MQDKQIKSKETDITGVLVIAFFVMLGLLFVSFTSNLTKKSTSTSTRAADACKNSPFGYSGYVSSADYCSSLNKQCGDGYVVDLVATGPGCSVCCRSTSAASYLSTTNCIAKTGDSTAKCVPVISKAGTGRSKTTSSCGYVTGRFLKVGVCDKATSSTAVINSAQSALSSSILSSNSDCGPAHLNCSGMFGAGGESYNHTADQNNMDSNSKILSGICSIPEQYSTLSNKNDYATCVISMENAVDNTQCQSGLYAKSGTKCFKSLTGPSSTTPGGSFRVCFLQSVPLNGSTCQTLAQ